MTDTGRRECGCNRGSRCWNPSVKWALRASPSGTARCCRAVFFYALWYCLHGDKHLCTPVPCQKGSLPPRLFFCGTQNALNISMFQMLKCQVHQTTTVKGKQHSLEANISTAVTSLLSYLRLFSPPQGNRRADDGRKVRGSRLRQNHVLLRSGGGRGVSQVSCWLPPAERHIGGKVVRDGGREVGFIVGVWMLQPSSGKPSPRNLAIHISPFIIAGIFIVNVIVVNCQGFNVTPYNLIYFRLSR